MQKQIDSWFPTLVYKTSLDSFQDKNYYLEKKAYSLKLGKPIVATEWNCDTYNTLNLYNPFNDNDSIVKDLISLCKDRVYDFSKEFGIFRKIDDLICTDFWFNIAQPGNYQECHQHPNSHFSLVYYVSVDANCGNIVFKSPTAFSDMFPLSIHSKNLNNNSYPACCYTPAESLLLIFRSNLVHMVEKNHSHKDRISVTMNFKFKD